MCAGWRKSVNPQPLLIANLCGIYPYIDICLKWTRERETGGGTFKKHLNEAFDNDVLMKNELETIFFSSLPCKVAI